MPIRSILALGAAVLLTACGLAETGAAAATTGAAAAEQAESAGKITEEVRVDVEAAKQSHAEALRAAEEASQ
jgi:hypothetical protein